MMIRDGARARVANQSQPEVPSRWALERHINDIFLSPCDLLLLTSFSCPFRGLRPRALAVLFISRNACNTDHNNALRGLGSSG